MGINKASYMTSNLSKKGKQQQCLLLFKIRIPIQVELESSWVIEVQTVKQANFGSDTVKFWDMKLAWAMLLNEESRITC